MRTTKSARPGLGGIVATTLIAISLGTSSPAAPAPGSASGSAGGEVDPGVYGRIDVAGSLGAAATYEKHGRILRIFGDGLAAGATPVASAEAFLDANPALLGVERAELVPFVRGDEATNVVPVMFDRERGTYRFQAVSFTQVRGGIEVYGSRMTMLVRNRPGFPVVLVNPDVRPLGAFRVDPADLGRGAMTVAMRKAVLDRAEAVSKLAGPARVRSTRTVIWAGLEEDTAPPRLAEAMSIDVGADRWLFIVDARTGGILHEENLVCTIDISGNVSGLVTEGVGAEQCEAEVATPLPYLRVTAGAAQGFTNLNGDYVISGLLGLPVTVTAGLSGQWFDVLNDQGAESILTQGATPPATVNFLFNAANTEALRAQANAYYYSNSIRDFVLAHHPAYPTLASSGFPVHVNRTDGFCPGNAWYDPADVSINFCLSSATRPNTAWSSVIYHEYGHHLVAAGGSGQGGYGEGMGDCMSAIILDDPALGLGFFNDCSSSLRNADNNCQYSASSCSTCGSEAHDCGNLLSGCIWSTRDELVVTEPVNYRDILGALTVNSILLHSGSSIDASITIDFLVLDDDDETIFNGTPHYAEIAAGFGAHGLPAPALAPLEFTFPDGLPSYVSPGGGTTARVEVSPIGSTPQPGTGRLHYDVGGGFVSVAMTQLSPNVYDATFPAEECGTAIAFYFSSMTTGGATAVWPVDAPAGRFDAIAAFGSTDVSADNMEADGGWTVENVALDDGAWSRGVPAGAGDRGDPTVDADGSGSCWLTDNTPGNSDVDGGPTRLISYLIDLSSVDEPVISYARWFTNDDSDGDRLDVHVSNNGGASWTLVESVGNFTGWVTSSFRVADFVPPTAQVRVRFSATDNPNNSVTEAGIDALRVTSLVCTSPCPADIDGSGDVAFGDLLALLASWGPCGGCPEDITGDGSVDFSDLLGLLAGWGACP